MFRGAAIGKRLERPAWILPCCDSKKLPANAIRILEIGRRKVVLASAGAGGNSRPRPGSFFQRRLHGGDSARESRTHRHSAANFGGDGNRGDGRTPRAAFSYSTGLGPPRLGCRSCNPGGESYPSPPMAGSLVECARSRRPRCRSRRRLIPFPGNCRPSFDAAPAGDSREENFF
jgi:hypothetical protein